MESRCPKGQGGLLVIRQPWPSMARTIYGDPERFEKNYWSEIPGTYLTGDGARQDEDGYFWLMGRVDDVINVCGHRLGTMEVESALVGASASGRSSGGGPPGRAEGPGDLCFCHAGEWAQAFERVEG